MGFNLRNRNFLKELDFTKEELAFLLKLSKDLKAAKYAGTERQRLARLVGADLLVGLQDQGAETQVSPDNASLSVHDETRRDRQCGTPCLISRPLPHTAFFTASLAPPRLFARLTAHCSLTILVAHDNLLL